MTAFHIENARSGDELGRYYAESAADALNAMARNAGYEDFARACETTPEIKRDVVIYEL